MAAPSTPPSRNPHLDNHVQHHVPSDQPPSMSLADTRLKTLRLLLQGYSSLSVPTLLQPLSPKFTHEVLPKSLGMPVRGKEDFAHHAAMVFSAFKSFEMKPTELWEDPDRGEVILRCAMEGVLKTKEKPEGEKEESEPEKDGKVEAKAEKEVIPSVNVGDEYCPDEDPELEPVDLSNILGDLPELPDRPETVLSPITEVTEPPSEFSSSSSSFNLSNPSSSQEEPTSSSPPSSVSAPLSPPPPAPKESSQQEDPNNKSTPPSNTEEIHWNNECLLIISFTPCGSQISKIQEFVDSAKAVEMKKKHAPKGSFDEASASAPPVPPTYKPAKYLDLDTLKLKDAAHCSSVTVTELLPPSPDESLVSSVPSSVGSLGGSMTGISPHVDGLNLHVDALSSRLDRGVQCAMDSSLDTLDTFSTTTEYPSSGRNSLCLDRVAWHSTEAEAEDHPPNVFQGVGGQTNAFSPSSASALLLSRLAKSERKLKRLRFAKHVEDIGVFSGSSHSSAEGAGSGSESGHVYVHGSGFWTSGDPVDHEHEGSREKKGWTRTFADTIEVINQFVPPQLLPVGLDDGTRQVVVKKEWISGAATFVAGFVVGRLWFGGRAGGRSR